MMPSALFIAMTEMTPQQAAAVWTQVPQVEQELTPRVVGLANILTGLAIAVVALPTMAVDSVTATPWAQWSTVVVALTTVALVLLFLGLRSALWRVYGLAKPEGRTLLYRHRMSGSWRWLPVDWWYLGAVAWSFAVGFVTLPEPLEQTGSLIALLLTVYTLAGGIWESRQTWSRRPYLLAVGVVFCGLGWGLHIAGVPEFGFAIHLALGLTWILAGTALYHQV